jgi:hypothetical protein
MLIGRSDERMNPKTRMACSKAVPLLWSRSRIPSGPAAMPHQKAGHMTAIAPISKIQKKTLASKGPSTHGGFGRSPTLLAFTRLPSIAPAGYTALALVLRR